MPPGNPLQTLSRLQRHARQHEGRRQVAVITLEYFVYYLIAMNFIAFAAFGIDKALAEANRRRISENRLLSWAMLGGTAGAYAGRSLFRHKTRKKPFSQQLHAIALLQAALAVLVIVKWPFA